MVKSEDLPAYDHIDDLVLIGTSHNLDCRKDKDKTLHFGKEFKDVKHLILEGYKKSYENKDNRFNYEALAYQFGQKLDSCQSVHFIEEGEDFIEANGIRKDLMGLYMALYFIPMGGHFNSDEKKLDNFLNGLFESLDHIYPAIDRRKTPRQLAQVFWSHKDIYSLHNLAKAWTYHSSRNRDHYIFGPKSKKWKEELEGKKVELVGYNHFLFLQKYLRGEEIPPLGHWRETLDDKHRKVAEDIEERIFPRILPK